MSLEASRRLVESLRRPDAYAHPVGAVELKETHISWVLLTGDFVYKIKKPVRLDFLDFSTLERRRFFCEEELRLNRRFAPQLYVDVVPISGSHDAPRVGADDGEPIEYAVRLKQFEAGAELRDRLAHGAVEADSMHEFGQRLAEMHASSPGTQDFGAPAQTRETLMRNVSELARALGERGAQVDTLSTWLDGRLRELTSLMESRHRSSRIRECHGDLHAGNVVFHDGRWLPFDCIEFDPALRCIDPISDAAFLSMDLRARGHVPLAYAFLNGWLEGGGEYDAVPLLCMFEVHRALVRAKIAALEGNEAELRRYLDTATALSQPRSPMLILTCGLSGSGKTWLSTRLMSALGALRIRSDVERKRMAGLKPHESSRSLPESIYTLEFNDRVYRRLLDVARTAVISSEHIIVDAASLKRAERESFIGLAFDLGVPIRIVHCTAPLDVLRSRLTRRQAEGKDASEADVPVLERQLGSWQPFSDLERPYVIEIDTSTPDPAGRAVALLGAANPFPAR